MQLALRYSSVDLPSIKLLTTRPKIVQYLYSPKPCPNERGFFYAKNLTREKMKELIDKAVVIAGSSTTAISGGTAVKIDGSMINGLLNSTLGDVMTGQFTWYMSDVVTLVSLSATLTMVFWRIKQDKKKDNE